MEALDGFLVDRSKLRKCLFRNGPGVPYRKSRKTEDTRTQSWAAWDSVVWGKEEDGFVKVGQCYLPMIFCEVPVLVRTSVLVTSDGIPINDSNTLAFRVTRGTLEEVKESLSPISRFSWNKQKSAPADGLPYLKTQDITDLDRKFIAPWGSVVFGTLTDGFLKIGHRYLPTHVDGECVLVQQDPSAIPDTSSKENNSSAVHNETQVGTPKDDGVKLETESEEHVNTKESVATIQSVASKESAALVETNGKDNTQLDEVNFEDDAAAIQVTENQQQLKSENQVLSKRLDVIAEGVWELTSGLSSLSFRFEKVKSDLEDELAAFKESNSNVLRDQNVRDTELESRTASFESRLSTFEGEGYSFAINKIEARLVEHGKRIASCEDRLSHLMKAELAETPVADVKELRQVQLEILAERTERTTQISELLFLKEQLLPRLEACEAELNKKVFGADFETELLQIKETVSLHITKLQEEFSPHVSDITKNMNKLASGFADDLELHLAKVGRDFEARLTTHVQDTDARLAIFGDLLYKSAGSNDNDASAPKMNPPGLNTNSNALGADSHLANDGHPPNLFTGIESAKAGGPHVQAISQGQRVSNDGLSQDLCWSASLQDMQAIFWASEAPSVDETPPSIRPIHSVSSPQIRLNPTGDHLHSRLGQASPARRRVFLTGSSAGPSHRPAQSTPLSNPSRSSTPQRVSSRQKQSPSSGAIYVQSGTPRSVSPQSFVSGGGTPMGAVYVRPGTQMS